MSNKHLVVFWFLLLSLAAGNGCAQKIAKQDKTAVPPAAQPARQEGDAQAATAPAHIPAATQTAAAAAPAAANTTPAPPVKDTPAPQRPPAAASAPANNGAAVALLPLPPREIVDAIKKLTTHPRVLYLSRSAQYDYYVGGSIDAKYDIGKSELVVTNAPAKDADTVTCQYSKDGEMIDDKKSAAAQTVAECNKLINELTGYLAH